VIRFPIIRSVEDLDAFEQSFSISFDLNELRAAIFHISDAYRSLADLLPDPSTRGEATYFVIESDGQRFTIQGLGGEEYVLDTEADASVIRLRGALEPFAKAAESADGDGIPDSAHAWESAMAMAVTYGDFRRARQALQGE
jgi:hypothetical protein